MTKFSIEYNPYLLKCSFKKNDKELGANSKIGAKSSKRLQELLGSSGSENWRGLIEEIIKACNDREIEVCFRGRRIDFDDLQYCIQQYTGDVSFQLSFQETKNDADVIRELDSLMREIKQKNLLQFKEKNREGKDIFDAYEEVKNGIFEVSVIATMSSGKSTLINSILQEELLPSAAQACTAKVTKILDNDAMDSYVAECYGSDGRTKIYPKATATHSEIQKYNSDERVKYIDIEGNIPAIASSKIRLCIIDTPGPNNTRNEEHGRLTNSIIKRTNTVVLYVLNATQLEIKDDRDLLKDISSEMKRAGKQSRDRFLFVINKCDTLDEQKGETVETIMTSTKEYLQQFGIEDPIMIPISAFMALLVRKNRNGGFLTRLEKSTLNTINDFVESPLLHYEEFAVLTPTVKEILQNRVKEYHVDKEQWDMEGLIHTGVPALEETIKEYVEKYAYPMKIQDAVKDIIRILKELDMKNRFDEAILNDSKKLNQVQKQIQMAITKHEESKGLYNDYRRKVEGFCLELLDADDENFKVEMEMQNRTKVYDDKQRVDKIEAENLINEFQIMLDEYQKECESRLNREIDEKIFRRGTEMLEEYTKTVTAILEDIPIEGFDFQKISSFEKIRLTNISDITRRNEMERFRTETRVKDNPERKGFFGVFKFWKPKKIRYSVQVKDGIDVNVLNVITEIAYEFMNSIKANINSMFEQAETQINEYREAFMDNMDALDKEIKGILEQLKKDTEESQKIQKRVTQNRELSQWVTKKEKEISELLSF